MVRISGKSYTERFSRKAAVRPGVSLNVNSSLSQKETLTRVVKNLDTMTHHRHFVKRWLTIEEYVAGGKGRSRVVIADNETFHVGTFDSLAIDEMSLDDPPVLQLQRDIGTPVFQIDTLARVLQDESRAGV